MASAKGKPTKARRKAAIKPKPAKRVRQKGERRRIFGRVILPAFLSFAILVCLGALFFLGYSSLTASDFFRVRHIGIFGTERSSREEIERIVAMETEASGSWQADLNVIRARIEKMPFVKAAAVSRVLPNEIHITIKEQKPIGTVRLAGGDFLINSEGQILAPASGPEPGLPVTLIGWDERKSPVADRENAERLKIFLKFMDEARQQGLESRISALDVADIREPRAVTEDSGASVTIAVGRENFGENLKRGIKAIVGKGEIFEAVNLVGQNMILAPRKTTAKSGAGK
ncbi:MAG TPA: hypothetical protein DEA22_00875 [Blastocatellia bacterium]|nr:hypothetical protein [Blastocatellia bacterium]